MLYNIYVKNNLGEESPIHLNVASELTIDRIKHYCSEMNVEVGLIRINNKGDGSQIVDVGSHSLLFIVKKVRGGGGVEHKIIGRY